MWITLNEPNDEMVSYQEGHQMLRAHALAWHAYDRDFRHGQGGQVSRTAVLKNRDYFVSLGIYTSELTKMTCGVHPGLHSVLTSSG